jgi:deoxyribodipyrimidine photo-lyase
MEVLPVPDDLCSPKKVSIFTEPMEWSRLCSFFPKMGKASVSSSLQAINERSAWDVLGSFLTERGAGYSGGISSPNSAFTSGSRLSAHLAWGTISAGSVFLALDQRREELSSDPSPGPWKRSLRAFESRLHWRDHFIQRLEGCPTMEFSAINPIFNQVKYEDDSEMLACWLAGKTGFPLIDACMRCLQETGFLNFRMRAMVVSFACFGLHLSWRTIHGPLAQIFLDYEPGIHLSQLQMQAGITGINAIRVYSPAKQLLDQDADCRFVKRWVPELRNFKTVQIAHAEEIKLEGYPEPVVSLKEQAKKMKDQIFSIRRSTEAKESNRQMLRKYGSAKSSSRGKKNQGGAKGQLALFKD